MSVDEIEKAVTKLSREDLAAFREWFAEYASDRWDDEIVEDVAAGKVDKLAKEALKDYAEGRVKKL